MTNHDITKELKELCSSSWLPIELIEGLINAQKWNLSTNRWTSHRAMIESLIKEYIK